MNISKLFRFKNISRALIQYNNNCYRSHFRSRRRIVHEFKLKITFFLVFSYLFLERTYKFFIEQLTCRLSKNQVVHKFNKSGVALKKGLNESHDFYVSTKLTTQICCYFHIANRLPFIMLLSYCQ